MYFIAGRLKAVVSYRSSYLFPGIVVSFYVCQIVFTVSGVFMEAAWLSFAYRCVLVTIVFRWFTLVLWTSSCLALASF